jgi:hypothetical protein
MTRDGGRGAGHRTGRHRLEGALVITIGICLIASMAVAGDRKSGGALEAGGGPAGRAAAHPTVTDHPADGHVSDTTIRLGISTDAESGAASPRRFLSAVPSSGPVTRRLVAVPDCDAARVTAVTVLSQGSPHTVHGDEATRLARVEEIVRIRDQMVAVVTVDPAALERYLVPGPIDGVEIEVASYEGSRPIFGVPASTNTGPFTRACERSILNYAATGDAAPSWLPPAGPNERPRAGTATYCSSVAECATAEIDILFVVADALALEPDVLVLAEHQASYLGLNVGIVGTSDLPELSAEALQGFIADVYETESAEHFGDGHLGFVVLIGDAFADDNTTVMIPVYHGYGGEELASDHYFACVSGDDDYEDVMLGRLSVGTVDELATVVDKAVNYAPLSPPPDWHDQILLIGGLFYANKSQYVQLFDGYEEIIPAEVTVDRIYRHDFGTTAACAQAIADAVNDNGYLFMNFAGDGWISVWYHTMDTSHIQLMSNPVRLPIVLSMACMTGWLDNTTEPDETGSYDCMAEQLVNAEGRGAIACLAAPRASDGAIFRTLTEKVYRAAYEEHCIFIGETMAVAKLLHLQDGGGNEYTRQFNLFGDPTLIYSWDVPPSAAPDFAVKSHQTEWSSDLPSAHEDLELTVTVASQSPVSAGPVLVRVTDVSVEGTDTFEETVPWLNGWSVETVEFTIPTPAVGPHQIEVAVDPDDDVQETDETNNSFTRETYVYPYLSGFPSSTPTGLYGACSGYIGGERHIVAAGDDSRVIALRADGSIAWQSSATIAPILYGPEVAPSIGDIDGDGENEVVSIRRSGVWAFEAGGGEMWSVNTQEPVGSPVLADADGDGDLDAIVATRAIFGSGSSIVAFDEGGGTIWTHNLPSSGGKASAQPVAGDFDLDGSIDVAYGTSAGYVGAFSTTSTPPADLWNPVQVASSDVTVLALGDLDDDGLLEIVAGSTDLFALNAETGAAHWDVPLGAGVVSVAIGDADGDQQLEVIAGTESPGTLHLVDGGSEIWGVPLTDEPASSVAIADVDADGDCEILAGTLAGYVHVLNADGSNFIAPLPLPGASSTPFVASLTEERLADVSVCSDDGTVFALRFTTETTLLATEWCGLGGRAGRAGVHAQPIEGTFGGTLLLDGRYTVTGDVVVQADAELTVAPETLVEFDAGPATRLEVNGDLEVNGRPWGEVVMRAVPGTAQGWHGIDVRPGGSAALTSCRVRDAWKAVGGLSADATVTSCELTDNVYGVYLEYGTFHAADTRFALSESVGIYLKGGSGSIAGCTVDSNFRHGLELDRGAVFELVGSTFSNTLAGDGVKCRALTQAETDSCVFVDNAGHGVSCSGSSPVLRHALITGNGGAGIQAVGNANPVVGVSTIDHNYVGVECSGGATADLGSEFEPLSGMNTIELNEHVAVANYSGLGFPVYARRNWWGDPTPGLRRFIGPVISEPALSGPPGGRETTTPDAGDEAPSAYRLAQNAPNPFNPITTLRYEIPSPGCHLVIAVHDASGRRVATLHSGHRSPGLHEATWDGRNDRGERVASGVYFARMVAPDFTTTRKMILLK